MKHKRGHAVLGRERAARSALFVQQARALLRHGAIVSTEAKGKALKRMIEPLVTFAKTDSPARRRTLLSRVRGSRDAVQELVDVAKRFTDRPGGYVRLTKLIPRIGDAARRVRVEWVEKEIAETKTKDATK